MENFNQIEKRQDPGLETRPLTIEELVDFTQTSEFLDINIHELAQDPSVEITMVQTRDGTPMEIKIEKNGKPVFYDDLAFWRKLKARREEPKNIIH